MKKKYMAALLVILFIVQSFEINIVEASSINDDKRASYEVYVNACLPGYLQVNNFDCENDFYLSQPLNIINSTDPYKKIIFVFEGDTCVGILTVTIIDEEFASSFLPIRLPIIDVSVKNNIPFVLYSDGEHLIYRNSKELIIIEGNPSKAVSQNLNPASTNYESITLSQLNLPNEKVKHSNYRSSHLLNVPIVANLNSPDTGIGLCWAASMASIIRFRVPGNSSLDALTLYYQLKANYPSAGTPYGSPTWKTRCFVLYNLSYSQQPSGMTYDSSKSIINCNLPILCDIKTSSNTDNHSVVLAGYENEYGYYYYLLMDPNCSNIVTVQVTNTAATSFTYVTTWGSTYTNWYYTLY